ncbi:MAG: gluconate 2-dehydrogenase subunit 3 family protein [Salinirussus sp.]
MTDDTTRLTRRDALAALAATGAAGVGLAAITRDSGTDRAPAPDDTVALGAHERETLTAVARVVYPEAVDGIAEFVRTYADGRAETRPERARAIADAVATLDERADRAEDAPYVDLLPGRQETLLREMGVDVIDPDPEGIVAARLRYYLVNELLFALYASPTGGRLVGIENPQGYPGGIDSYRRGPDG